MEITAEHMIVPTSAVMLGPTSNNFVHVCTQEPTHTHTEPHTHIYMHACTHTHGPLPLHVSALCFGAEHTPPPCHESLSQHQMDLKLLLELRGQTMCMATW